MLRKTVQRTLKDIFVYETYVGENCDPSLASNQKQYFLLSFNPPGECVVGDGIAD